MEHLWSVLGGAIVIFVLRDIFHTLWHPQGFGSLARRIVSTVWAISKSLTRRGGSELAGPLGILTTVVVWAQLIVLGWALVYLPWMPSGFYFDASLEPAGTSDLLSSLYLSSVTLATLGFGDITPAVPILRLVAPLQALIGFVLLTAAISWILQIYPALGRRRAMAAELSVLAATDTRELVDHGDPHVVAPLLHSLARSLVAITVDLAQYPESYYFWESESSMSLPANLAIALDLADAGHVSAHPEVQHAGATVHQAAEGLAERLRAYPRGSARIGTSTRQAFADYARDHGRAGTS